MFIQHISIQNFGAIGSYEAKFTPYLNLIDSRHTDEMAAVLTFLLCSNVSCGIPEQWLRENTRICAKISMAEKSYTLCAIPEGGRLRLFVTDPAGKDSTDTYRYTLSHCPEQDAVEIFDGQDKTIPQYLCRYRDREGEDDLSAKTQRLADTKTFRRYLLQYIKDFRPEPINTEKRYQVTLAPTGKFRAVHPDVPGEIHLSETEEKLFRYVCFLNVAAFWADIEKIRDLHHERKPLLIRNFLEYLDVSTDIDGLLVRSMQFQRQIMILSPPLDEEIKKKWLGEQNE